MNSTRRQLTFFIEEYKEVFEAVRLKYNPKQFELIAAHVTVCREDEIESADEVVDNLRSLQPGEPVTINFGPVERFSERRGVLLPGICENQALSILRRNILKGILEEVREIKPHITLMHPRNSTFSEKAFEEIQRTLLPNRLTFNELSLIEQKDGGKWSIIERFSITSKN